MDYQQGLRLIGELGRQIPACRDAQTLAHALHDRLAACLPIDVCTIALPSAAGTAHFTYPVAATPDRLLGVETSVRQGALAMVAAGVVSGGPQRSGGAPAILSRLAAGIRCNGHLAGEIALGTAIPNAYSAVDQQVLDAVAGLLDDLDLPAAPAPDVAAQPDGDHREALTALAAMLGTISRSIVEEAPPEQVYALILEQAATLIPYDEAVIQIFERGRAEPVAAIGPSLKHACEELSGDAVWQEYRPLDYALRHTGADIHRLFEALGILDFLSLPVLVNDTVAARISFASREPGRYRPDHLHIGALVAERTAQAMRAADLRASLETARTKTAQLDILRHDFVSTVSHQLRTPLTGILGYLELLLNRWTSLDDERRRSMLQRAQSSAVRLEHLVTDLLLFSNLEHQELKLQLAHYPLSILVNQAVEDMSTKYRGQVIQVRPAKGNAVVRADAQRTVQVLSNLLDNAIKYSDIGSYVEVRWIMHRTEVEVSVRDHGPGIKSDDLPRLFTRFGTLGHHPRPGQIGTGIGLYVSKRLLDAMGGRIWATSRLGHGSIFHFTLPCATHEGLRESR